MIWTLLISASIVGVVVYEFHIAPEVDDDYEIELWEKYQSEQHDDVPPPVEKPIRYSDAA